MTIINSVSAVFAVVKAARRVKEARKLPLKDFDKALNRLEKTVSALEKLEEKSKKHKKKDDGFVAPGESVGLVPIDNVVVVPPLQMLSSVDKKSKKKNK